MKLEAFLSFINGTIQDSRSKELMLSTLLKQLTRELYHAIPIAMADTPKDHSENVLAADKWRHNLEENPAS